ncbi:DUF2087 domain-containing protein [Epibacterium ulvae]|uniref:DUF2087 domain-containing protein n=1 Tax=Epibacterium ulvae TaxID=1156985 RepID=UPI001BFC6FD6|nr:DUF2087 domain-containing protein [Epibacterium ulvae]MBT8152460.1 DUF2087 domain-containing protein [Epibacterium ulvae]
MSKEQTRPDIGHEPGRETGRNVIQLTIDDLSQFTKTLRKQLDTPPSHVEMLTHVARAAGYRNYQHLRARNTPVPQANRKQVDRAARYFDEAGQWARWPLKRGVRELCLWVVWAAIPARERFSERQVSAVIDEMTVFRDAAQIRRSLIEMQLMRRDRDGSNYQRLEQPMPPEARALLAAIKERRVG